MKRTIAEAPYNDYYLHGPYFHKNEGRHYVNLILIEDRSQRTTVSLARYKVATSLGRFLGDDEHVDHINDDKSDDSMENLQVLTPEENMAKFNATRTLTTTDVICANCDQVFVVETAKFKDREKRRKYPACCTRSCAAKYQRRMELK